MAEDIERKRRVDPIVAVTLAGMVLLIALSFGRVVNDPFGESQDGRNGAVWASAARAIRSEGLVGSRLGAELDRGSTYANHPPLISIETSLGERALGEHRWVTRAPAWLGTLVALVLLWRILERLEFSVLARSTSLVLGVGCPMLLGFGSMLDTPVTSLPFALLAVLIWLGPRSAAWWPWARAGTALVATVAGWQAGLLILGTVVIDLFARRRRAAGMGALGLGLGVSALLAWQLWVYGSLANLENQLKFRAGVEQFDDNVTFGGALAHQAEWLGQLLTPLAVGAGLGGLVMLLGTAGPRREVAAALLGTIAGYTSVLWVGAYFHEYWSYWSVLLVVMGGAAVVDRLEAMSSTGRIASWWPSAVPLLALGMASANLLRPPIPLVLEDEGLEAVRAATVMETREIPVYGLVPSTAPWVTYETGRSAPYLNIEDLRRVAASNPDQPVLTTCRAVDESSPRCEGSYTVLPAGQLASLLRN